MSVRFMSWCALLVALLPLALGADPEAKVLVVHDAWIREAPPKAMALAGYAVIENTGQETRSLVGAVSPDFEWLELHRSVHESGVAKMVPQDSMPLPAQGRLTLKPGDYHLMMMKPARQLQVGDMVEVTLEFDNGTRETVDFSVRKGQGGHHEHHHH